MMKSTVLMMGYCIIEFIRLIGLHIYMNNNHRKSYITRRSSRFLIS